MNCTQQTDSFITGERGGKVGGEAGWRDIERTKRNVQKTERGRKKRGGRNRKRDGKRMKERKVFWVK